jgi:hypothetical protein
MPFTKKVKDEVLVASGRHCCICHKFCGTKIEVHHIDLESKKGKNESDNAIALCFDCHADMMSYDKAHPKGSKYSKIELKKHRNNWFKKVECGAGLNTTNENRELDVKLIKIILDYLPYDSSAINLIKNYDFGSRGFLRSDLNAFDELLDKMESNPAFEFMDPELEGLRCDFQTAISEFKIMLRFDTGIDRSNPKYNTARPNNWDDMEDNKRRKWDKIFKKLNRGSNSIYNRYGNLIKAAQRKLGISLVDQNREL